MLKAATSPRSAHTALDLVFVQEFDREKQKRVGLVTAESPLFFKQDTHSGDQVILDQFSGVGLFTERTNVEADIAESNPSVTNNQILAVKEFARNVAVPRTFKADEKHGIVQSAVRDLGYKALVSQDKINVEVYANGFTTTLANDGIAWFNDSHTNINGQTVDNNTTGALTATTFETTLVLLGRQKGQDGALGNFNADLALVPYNLLAEATAIIDSEYVSGSGNNDVNYLSKKFPGLQLGFSQYLDETSTTAYFLLSDRHSCTRWVVDEVFTNYIPWESQKNLIGNYRAVFREVTNPISYEAAVGSTGV